MRQFEYIYVETIDNVTNTEQGPQGEFKPKVASRILSDMGKEGWEAVYVIPDPWGHTLMKREIIVKKKWYQR